ncbi:MAG: Fur family transcriptional regulator [Acidimicrobiia bacterium]
MAGAHHRDPHIHDDIEAHTVAVLDLLRADGGRITTGRRAIVHALLAAPDHHVTAEDIAAAVQADHPDVHVSTVYRTLDSLERLRVLSRVNLGHGGAVYHLVDHAHHHLVCESCGSVTEVPDSAFAPLARQLDKRYEFTLSPHHVAVTGLCAACR